MLIIYPYAHGRKDRRQDVFPLLKRDQHHGAPVCHYKASIVFAGFDIENIVKIYFHISAVLADKEK